MENIGELQSEFIFRNDEALRHFVSGLDKSEIDNTILPDELSVIVPDTMPLVFGKFTIQSYYEYVKDLHNPWSKFKRNLRRIFRIKLFNKRILIILSIFIIAFLVGRFNKLGPIDKIKVITTKDVGLLIRTDEATPIEEFVDYLTQPSTVNIGEVNINIGPTPTPTPEPNKILQFLKRDTVTPEPTKETNNFLNLLKKDIPTAEPTPTATNFLHFLRRNNE